MSQQTLVIDTHGRGMTNITPNVADLVANAQVTTGLCHLFIQHTSASLIICENADPQVLDDLNNFFNQWVPDGSPLFGHSAEGEDDMPAHIRSVVTHTSLSIPIANHKLLLGTWQGIFLWEHRYQHYQRKIVVTLTQAV